jgi:hypothetical protein
MARSTNPVKRQRICQGLGLSNDEYLIEPMLIILMMET